MRILLLMLLLNVSVQAQSLYFIKAVLEDYITNPPLQILKYSNGVLSEHKDLSKMTSNTVVGITDYKEINAICFTTNDFNFFILGKNKPDTLIRLPLLCSDNYQPPLHIKVADNKWIYKCYFHEAPLRKDIFRYKGIDLSMNERYDLTPDMYKDVYSTGSYFYGNDDVQNIVLMPDDNKIYLPVIADTLNRPTMEITLPDKYIYGEKTFSAMLINDSKQMVIKWKYFDPKQGEDTATHSIIIYNKTNKEWIDVLLKGNEPEICAYDYWLAGRVVEKNIPGSKYTPPKISPGKEQRDSLFLDYPYDEINYYYGRYAKGILYLYNTLTKQYIEWTTNQGDSEVLMVHKNDVYYRVFDKIFKANILENELSNIELLIQNPDIPYIHWAFLDT